MFAGRGQQLWPDEMPLDRRTRLARPSGVRDEHCAICTKKGWAETATENRTGSIRARA